MNVSEADKKISKQKYQISVNLKGSQSLNLVGSWKNKLEDKK